MHLQSDRQDRKGGAKTFLIDLPIVILFGMLFSFFERAERYRNLFSSPYLWHGLFFMTIFNVAVLYGALFYPDWMWMYFLEKSPQSWSVLVYLLLFFYYLPYLLGFFFGYELRNKSHFLWWCFVLGLLCAEGWLVVKLFDRYRMIGTREEFLNGTALPFLHPDNTMGLVVNLCAVVLILYYVLIFYKYKRESRKTLSL